MAELQTLFSLELDVDFVRVQPSGVICRIPAVAFRLMDFPTLLIHHVSPGNVERIKDSIFTSSRVSPPPQLKELKDHRGNFVFKKGKSCLFKSNIDNLLGHLRNTPLYVMILDMWPTVPKLVGNCSVSLQGTIENIVVDVERTGISVPTVHGTKDNYKVYNLMGSEIGYVFLGFKLLSLGAGLISHIPESSITKPLSSRNIYASKNSADKRLSQAKHSGDVVLENLEEFAGDELPIEISTSKQETEKIAKAIRSSSTQTRRQLVKSKQKTHKKYVSVEEDVKVEDDELGLFVTNTICPPPLFFNSNCDDLSNQSENPSSKKASQRLIPEPEESEDSFSSAGFLETHYVFPPDSQHSVRKVHRKPHHKPSDGVDARDSNPEHRSVAVQSSPDVRTITSGLLNQNLPILAALLRELSVLQSNRPVNLLPGQSPHHQTINTLRAAVTPRENDRRQTEDEPDKSRVRTKLKHVDEAKKASKGSNCRRPRSSKEKTKLTFGMTHSQKLRLRRNNPEHLKMLEREESMQKRGKSVMKSTYRTPNKVPEIPIEIQRHPNTLQESFMQDVSKEGKQRFDFSSQESEGNKENKEFKAPSRQRPVPAPSRQRPIPVPRRSKESLSSRTEDTGAVQEREEIQSYMSVSGIHKNIEQEIPGNEEESSHPDSKDESEMSSRRIEVHIPSVSNYTNESDCDRTGDFTDQSEDADNTVSHASPKKTIHFPGFSNEFESGKHHNGETDEKELIKKEETIEYKGGVKTVTKKSMSENVGEFDNKRMQRVGLLTEPDPIIQSGEFEHVADGEILERAQFEDSYSTDFDVGDSYDNEAVEARNDDVLEYAEFEGSYSYDFDTDDQSRRNDVRPSEVDDDQDEDSLDASLSTTTSSSRSSASSQRSFSHPMPHSSRLQKGSLAIPKPTLSSKSPLPNKKTSGHASGGNLYPKTTGTADPISGKNVDASMNTATKSSVHSEFLTGDSDILQSTAGTGRTRSSDDYDPSYSDLLTDGSREF